MTPRKPRAREGETRKSPVRITEAILDEILQRLEQGESLSGICDSDRDRLPTVSSITDLCDRDSSVNVRYTRARNVGLDRLAERSLTVAGDRTRDPNCRRVELDALKWFTSKLRPDKYGDSSKLSVTGADGGAIQTESKVVVEFVRPQPLTGGDR